MLQPKDKSSAGPVLPMIEDAIFSAAGEGGVRSFHEHCSASGSKYSRVYRSGCEHILFRADLASEFADTQRWGILKTLNSTGRTHLYETNGPNSIKLIIHTEKRSQFYSRLYVKSKGFPVEEPLGYRMKGTFDAERIGYVFTSFVKHGIPLGDEGVSRLPRDERISVASMIVDLLVRMNNEDIVHTHPHNGNFVYIPSEKRIVMIDSPYCFGEDARAQRIDTLLYFLLRASGQPTGREPADYWHILRSAKLVEPMDIDRLMRQYLESSIVDYRDLHTGAQPLYYGAYSRHVFEHDSQIRSLSGAVEYLMKRMEFLQQCILHW
ncbi:Uncharacterised protein [uncultured archaeon]|nr:Uncharacterised protein [uncultured archaeon]